MYASNNLGGREIRYKDFFGEGEEGEGDDDEGEAQFDHEEDEEEGGGEEEAEAEEMAAGGGGDAADEESEVDEGALTAYERMKRAKRKEIEALEEELVAERCVL